MIKRLLIGCIMLAAVCCVILSTKITSSSAVNFGGGLTVVIDAGHGGADGGVVGRVSGVKEADLNLALSFELAKSFYAHGTNAILTRTNGLGLYGVMSKGFKQRDLSKRVEITKNANADIFISVHMNRFSDVNRRGAQVFYKAGCEKSKRLAQCIQDQLNGLKQSTRAFTPLKGDYYVLNNSTCTAVIVECGFLSNAQEEALLLTKEYRQVVADAIFYGTILYVSDFMGA